ncbi:LysR family transcriptional regulator [Litoribrevibacter albus]|uniref:LysR family transcriptional regulator n=1 Tax=Litoribrevibacter albus TaxID=1473156 RepID=A0AA37W7Q1_9GAMM|nr:LysR family transcriptional regulator [Litoribrevibacter albus]GLQ32965.1 LysR family transcriptional regulator [Litoribrevibacter albus]
MKLEELARYDIKLLVAFQVLLEEENVSRAAERMYVTQSAMSKMMARLKDMFGEELFFRTPHGIQATERALSLRESLYDTLEQLKQLLDPPEFDPQRCDRTFRISLMDNLAARICPQLMSILNRTAPNVKVQVVPWTKDSMDELSVGQLDLAVNIVDVERANFYEHVFARINPCILVRKGHPLTKKDKITLDEYLSYPFIKMVVSEFNDTQHKDREALERLGRQRNIVFETHNLNSAFLTLQHTDHIMLGGRGYNEEVFNRFGVVPLDIPSELDAPSFSYKIIWHQRQHKPSEQRWFRKLILDCLSAE